MARYGHIDRNARGMHAYVGEDQGATSELLPGKVNPQVIDLGRERELYGGYFAMVEPVCGNICHNKQLNRFMRAGRDGDGRGGPDPCLSVGSKKSALMKHLR